MISDGFAQAFEKLGSASGIDAIRQPGDFTVAGCFQEAPDGGKRFNPLDRIRFWRELAQRHPRGAGRHDRDVAGRFGQRHQRHAAAAESRHIADHPVKMPMNLLVAALVYLV